MNAEMLVQAMACHIVKAQHNLSYGDLAIFIECHLDMFCIYGMNIPSKSKLHAMSKLIMAVGSDFWHTILYKTSSNDTFQDLVGDYGIWY